MKKLGKGHSCPFFVVMRTIQELVQIIEDNHIRFYKTTEWKHIRVDALERDHYTCKRCSGEWKSNIPIKRVTYKKANHVHHIKPLKDYPKLCISIDNLVSLCFDCHEIVEERKKNSSYKEPLTPERW